MNKGIVLLLILLFVLSACSKEEAEEIGEIIAEPDIREPEEVVIGEPEEEIVDLPTWMDAELRDVNTGDSFRISDFAGEKVLLESFAVWCPLCLKQQQEVAQLEEGVHIALNTDPNEDVSLVKTHAQTYGFGWRFAVAPTKVTQSLIDDFGLDIVSAPSVPMILICEDSSFRKLGRGVKSLDTLKEELAKGC